MKILHFIFLFFVGMSLSSCGGCGAEVENDSNPSDEPEQTESTSSSSVNSESGGGDAASDSEPKNLAEALQQAQKAIEDSGIAGKGEVVNFRDLQKHLPEDLAGMERTSKGGETTGALGIKISTAEAKYKTDNGSTVKVTIADTGGIGMGLMGLAAWSTLEVDKEDENGSERTYTLDGNKAFEKVNKRNNSCELSVISKGRYVITTNCRECEIETLRRAIKEMDLGDLPEAEKE